MRMKNIITRTVVVCEITHTFPRGGAVMRTFSLFELFLTIFTFYAVYEGDMKILVPCLCLVTAYLFENLRKKDGRKKQQS